jgi:mycothiol synthase
MRTILKLERTLIESIPTSAQQLTIEAFNPERDKHVWLEVNNEIFAHHPDQGGWELSDLENRMAESWFDPNGFFLAKDAGEIIGFCWTKVHHDLARQGAVGELYVLGVKPDYSGKGIAKTLAIIAMNHLRENNINEAMLYVDADNTAALNLYRGLGFH